jgi:membrane-associated protease RseP (regulator of RpoE activity)
MDEKPLIELEPMPAGGPSEDRVWAKKSTRPRALVPALLFLATAVTTTTSGALFEGADPFTNPRNLVHGIPFSASLLLILGTHELGHFFASMRHGVLTTFPFFIPGPPLPPMIGTFGAVIRIKSPITRRGALVDIGATGPLAGFVVALVVTVWGLKLSWLIPVPPPTGNTVGLGSSIIFHLLTLLVHGPIPEGYDVYVHPVAFAGWIGFFVTSMNLLPIGQLDGGHMTYAVLGRFHRLISIAMVVILLVLGFVTWEGWLIWAVLVTILGLGHPPTTDADVPLDPGRRVISAITLAVFVLTFTPTPFYIR